MCGIAGYITRTDINVATHIADALYAVQHRGQEGSGIAVSDGKKIKVKKYMGLVKEAFTDTRLRKLAGSLGIGFVRYPTRGKSQLENTQPYVITSLSGPIYAIVSNGDIVNYDKLAGWLQQKGIYLDSDNDGELIGKYIVYFHEREKMNIVEAIKKVMHDVKGAYSAIFMTRNTLYAFRDVYGFRPLVLGNIHISNEGLPDVVLASETCALDLLEAYGVEEVRPGEIITITQDKIFHDLSLAELHQKKNGQLHQCIFELIYLAKPDSLVFNEYANKVRVRIGKKLAAYDEGEDFDVVVPVPDSANYYALGYAKQKHIDFDLGLVRNHYVGRTFIKPEQTSREDSVRHKFNPLKDFFEGKRVVLIDDSIVRSTTIKNLIRMIKKAGAKEVHLRIGSPPITNSCYYGIDTPNREKLAAATKSVEEIRQRIDANSLKYLKLEDLRDCVGQPDNYCYSCFTGSYPV